MAPLPHAFVESPIAHRGLHDTTQGIVENSLAAVRAAIDAGYGIEIDVQPSVDGRAMVFHDATLDRVTDASGPIAQRSAADLTALALSGTQDTIPLLSDVLAMVAGQVPLLIELKDQSGGLGPADDILERAVAADLKGYAGSVAVMSFNPNMIATMQRLAPDIPRGLVTCSFAEAAWPGLGAETCAALRSIRAFGKVGARFISHDWRDLRNPRVLELQSNDTPILCWTIKSPEDEAEARRVANNVTFEGYLPDVRGR